MAEADLDGQVRAADPDRWLSSRLVADPALRADLIALYAFEAELSAIPKRVTQPLLAEMRFTWWAEQLDGVFAGEPRKGHPVLEALAAAVAGRGLQRAPLEALIDAHLYRAHGRSHDLEALFTGPAVEAARLLGVPEPELAAPAGRLWGLIQTGQFEAARALRPEANRVLKRLPAAAFPALAHAALIDRDAPEPVKRLRLVWASLRGRV
ncbi:squalene/phytoene synthase family protein [Brevundimonas sp.]|uniref:squalene/phytoene synthase family protein n=1 Tax=Brevundimonas sp. TaxID=1871086 RepID=UPI0022CA3596|nr:squalene/phytoene synthase family protein [Brevundimonas sp.]MCZ8193280.1 squalene/phytoene synthase family protein [Brevundimonas sp.]